MSKRPDPAELEAILNDDGEYDPHAMPTEDDNDFAAIKDLMSDDEIKAMTELESGDDDDDDLADEDASSDGGDDQTDEPEGDDTDATHEDDGDDAALADADEADGKLDQDDADPVVTKERHVVPEDVLFGEQLEARLSEIETESKQLLDELQDGDITEDEYSEQLAAKNAEALKLTREAAEHEGIIKRQREAETKEWRGVVDAHREKNPEIYQDEKHFALLDRTVRALSNAGIYPNYESLMNGAHDLLASKDSNFPARAGTKPAPKPKPTAKKGTAKPVETLAGMPNASPASESTDDNPYVTLDAIMESGNSAKMEAALARLTEEQRNEYLSL